MAGRVDIKTGYSCNNNCMFCAVKGHPPGDKTTTEYITEMRAARPRNNEIVITGGEVTIRHDFLWLLSAAGELGYRIYLQTNGRRFSERQFCEAVSRRGISNYLVSFHGHNKELHETLTQAEGSFEETISGIKNLLDCDQNIQTNTVITTKNLPYLGDITRFLIRLGIKNIMYSYPDICGAVLDNINILPHYSMIFEQTENVVIQCQDAGVRVCFDNIPLCQMAPQYRMYANRRRSVDLIMLNSRVLDFSGVDVSLERCRACALSSNCCQPQQKYIDYFGDHFSAVGR